MKTSAIILVGGEGTRLRPLTLELPKPVVPVLDRPFLKFQLDLLRGAGIEDIVLCVAFRPERIRAVLGDGAMDGVRLTYVLEETPLGTGGAVKNAESVLGDRVVVMNGDVLADMDLGAILRLHEETNAAATTMTLPASGQHTIELSANAGSVTLNLPDGMEAQVKVDQALGGFDDQNGALQRVGTSNTWQTSGYENSTNRVTLIVHIAVGAVTLR